MPGKIRGPVPCFCFQYNLLYYSELVLVHMEHYEAISTLVRDQALDHKSASFFLILCFFLFSLLQ